MRILIRHGSTVRKFLVFATSDRDGSLSMTVRRRGTNTSQVTWNSRSGHQEPKTIEFDSPRPKNKRITIHQSGRVNYHENGKTIFVAPLTRTTQTFIIYRYRVPALDRLDVHEEEISEEDALFDLTDVPTGPVFFSVVLAPANYAPDGRAMKLEYQAEGYSITVQVDPWTVPIPPDSISHFITFTPDAGLFPEQQMEEDQAMISYHQALAGTQGAMLFSPNGEGVIRMIFSVPKRIAPRFKIELVDPDVHVLNQDVARDERSEKVMLKFKVRNRKSGQVVRGPIGIKSIELDAEM